MKSSERLNNNITDPVCGMAVDPKHSHILTTHAGCVYYFCAEGCRNAFEADPEKYLKGRHSKRKGWWGRYLERLEKATEGKSLSCH
ncbi:MAG: YHS domain-containing protein [Thermodesulfobacteriota bacterium]